MKALRIKLTQNKASYSREGTVNNRMTYPLPNYSTVIGALHNACGYTEYHPMEISIQGKYSALQKEIYVNHGLLNRTEDDRGILIWLKDPNRLNTGYIEVAKSLNATGNSFSEERTIEVKNRGLLDLYKLLKKKGKELEDFNKNTIKSAEEKWKLEKKELKNKQKAFERNSKQWNDVKAIIDEGEKKIKKLKSDFEDKKKKEYDDLYSHFKILVKGPQYQEVLYDVELVIHIKSDEEVLNDIMYHKYDFVSLGRSEDFIELIEMEYCEVVDSVKEEHMLPNNYSMFINADRVNETQFYQHLEIDKREINADGSNVDGTIYYIAKDYSIKDDARVFNRIPCLYSSSFMIDSDSINIGFDQDGGYLVDFN